MPVPGAQIYLGPGETVWTLIRFGPHKGDYMFHCHNLIHEVGHSGRLTGAVERRGATIPSMKCVLCCCGRSALGQVGHPALLPCTTLLTCIGPGTSRRLCPTPWQDDDMLRAYNIINAADGKTPRTANSPQNFLTLNPLYNVVYGAALS